MGGNHGGGLGLNSWTKFYQVYVNTLDPMDYLG